MSYASTKSDQDREVKNKFWNLRGTKGKSIHLVSKCGHCVIRGQPVRTMVTEKNCAHAYMRAFIF